MTIEELQARLVDINDECTSIKAKADAEKRDLSVEEHTKLNALLDEYDQAEERVEQLQRLQAQTDRLSRPNGRKTLPDAPANTEGDGLGNASLSRQQEKGANGNRRDRLPAQPVLQPKKDGGFDSLGEMAIAIRHSSRPGGGYIDPRLERLAAPTTIAGEGSGAEGGYAVPSDFRTSIMTKVMGEDSLLSRTDKVTIAGNTLTVPKDNGTPWGTTGVRAYWGSEGGLKNQSRPALDTMSLRLNKVYALVPVTDELAEDAPAMDSFLRRKAAEAIDFAINLAIIQGTGGSQPLGVLNSPALVSVAKESSQVADTITPKNIIKMWSRLWSPSRANAVWIVNQDVETQLYTMAMPGKDNTGADATAWGSHVFLPSGGLSGSPYATLFGRPIVPTQAANTLGDQGDVILADLSQYLTALKAGQNPKVDISIHLWFDYDVSAYRFVLRLTGQPWWDAPVSPRAGANTLSPFVTLDARA